MINLTDNEFKVLAAIDKSEYGDYLTDDVWTFTLADHCDLKGKSISGTVASLTQKGLVRSGGSGNEAYICMTDQGVLAYTEALAAQGGASRKESCWTGPRA